MGGRRSDLLQRRYQKVTLDIEVENQAVVFLVVTDQIVLPSQQKAVTKRYIQTTETYTYRSFHSRFVFRTCYTGGL